MQTNFDFDWFANELGGATNGKRWIQQVVTWLLWRHNGSLGHFGPFLKTCNGGTGRWNGKDPPEVTGHARRSSKILQRETAARWNQINWVTGKRWSSGGRINNSTGSHVTSTHPHTHTLGHKLIVDAPNHFQKKKKKSAPNNSRGWSRDATWQPIKRILPFLTPPLSTLPSPIKPPNINLIQEKGINWR